MQNHNTLLVGLPASKFCKKCNTEKLSSEFSVIRRKYNGLSGETVYVCLQSACKSCINARSKLQQRDGYVRPSKRKVVLNDYREIAMMQRAPSWGLQKSGVEKSQSKLYPVCPEGHRYVGAVCLPCKYALLSVWYNSGLQA